MKINYFISKKKYEVNFCRDGEGFKIRKKTKSYTNIARHLIKNYKDQKVLLVYDKNINKQIMNYFIHDLKVSFPKISIYQIKGQKMNKNTKELFNLLDVFFDKQFTKRSVVISCGGGVVGDICGLASSLYLRGLLHFHIPTTMTAIIDSCIGGKTGINYRGVINSLGTYYHPEKVYISRNILQLIPQREYIAGIPEIIKCGLIKKSNVLNFLKNKNEVLNRNFNLISKIIKLALETKIKFFTDDVYEVNKRLNLNFGHTFAHAIEMSLKTDNKPDIIRHGEAVGIGILCEIFYAKGKNKDYALVKKILETYDLPTNLNKYIKGKNSKKMKKLIFNNIFLDKKIINRSPRYVKISRVGKTKISEMNNFNLIKKTINKVIFQND